MPGPHGAAGAELRPGYKVGDYEVQRLLGRGGMGSVYQAVHPQIGKRVAIKVLSSSAGTEENTTRFLREAQVVNRIGHPGLVDIFSFGQLPSGLHYLVMELLNGEPLTARLARGPFAWAELLSIFHQMCSALQAAHDGDVVHRDLKPDNVFLVSATDGGAPRVKILDFGLAKILEAGAEMTQTGIALGTPRYMAPEQARGGRHVDHRVDIYALGLMLYEAVTGRFPFEAPTPILMLTVKATEDPPPPSRFALIPPALEALVLRALHKDPDLRFQSAREVAAALQAIGGPAAGVPLERRAPISQQRTVTMDPVTDAGFEAEATRVSRPDLPVSPSMDGSAPLFADEATRLPAPRAPTGEAGLSGPRPALREPGLSGPGPVLGRPPSSPELGPPVGPLGTGQSQTVARPPGPTVIHSLEAEETRLSPQRPAASRGGRKVLIAAGAALLLGALSAVALRATLAPRPPGQVTSRPTPAPPERPPPALAPPAERPAPAPAPQATPERRPGKPAAPPRRSKRPARSSPPGPAGPAPADPTF